MRDPHRSILHCPGQRYRSEVPVYAESKGRARSRTAFDAVPSTMRLRSLEDWKAVYEVDRHCGVTNSLDTTGYPSGEIPGPGEA
jgi:hypothetical protein